MLHVSLRVTSPPSLRSRTQGSRVTSLLVRHGGNHTGDHANPMLLAIISLRNRKRTTRPLLLLILLLLSGAPATNGNTSKDAREPTDDVSELELRKYLEYRAETFGYDLPDTLGLTVAGEKPSDELLRKLSDLETPILGLARADEFSPTHTESLKKHLIRISPVRHTRDRKIEVTLTYVRSESPSG